MYVLGSILLFLMGVFLGMLTMAMVQVGARADREMKDLK